MNRTRLLLALFALTAVRVSLPQSLPQGGGGRLSAPTPSTLRITVTYEDGQTRVRDVMVELQDAVGGSSAMSSRLTDPDGRVVFNTNSGTHRVRITGANILPFEAEFDIMRMEGDHVEIFRVRRKTGDQASSPEGEGTMPAIRLKIPDKAKQEYDEGKQVLEACSKRAAGSSGGGNSDIGSASEAVARASEGTLADVSSCGPRDWESSRKHFQAAIALYPDYDMAYNDLGTVSWQLHDAAGARAAFLKATQLNEQFAEAQRNLARILLGERNYVELAAHLNASLQMEPKNVWALAYAAYAELQTRRFQEAVDHARRAHGLPHGKLTWVHMVAGYALENLGRKQEAAEEFKKYLQEDPKGSDVKHAQEALARLASPPKS